MSFLPTGVVTFLFTDIEGSTRLWEQHPNLAPGVMAQHDEIIEEAVERSHGVIVRPRGEGDSRFAVFGLARDAILAAAAIQSALQAQIWPTSQPLRVRIAVHTGEADLYMGDYYGSAVNRCARLRAIAHGGQILVSLVTAQLVRDNLPAGMILIDQGEHRLKDLVRPEHVYQVGVPGLPTDFHQLTSINSFSNNLPIQLTSFIGREREMAEAKERLAAARLLTLIGSGGTGKTRLALQLGAELLPSFADGVWLVEMAALTDPSLISQTIADVFDLRQQPGTSLTEVLVDHLRAKNLLLIMDNCEHLVEACAELAGQLLCACGHIQLIVSSREVLGISGEMVYRIPSLSLPGLEQGTSAALANCESVKLFAERARAVNPKFALSDQNAPFVAQVCQRLDGIPLALELAAARAAVFSVEQIAARLDNRFQLLVGGSRTALPRHQTLRALIDWSYDLLSDDEQALIRRLSVFAGGWTLEAAESLVSSHDVLTLLAQLVNKSLVLFDEEDGKPRYRMLETVRQYARDKLLEMGESEEARSAHLDFFYQLVETGGPKMEWLQDLDWVWRVEAENDNLRAALEWALEKNVEAAMHMVWHLSIVWWLRGYEAEGRRWATLALARADTLPESDGDNDRSWQQRLRAYVYHTLAVLASSQGDHAYMFEASDRAARLAEELGDNVLLAMSLSLKVLAKLFVGDITDTEKPSERALVAARESGDQFGIGMALTAVGVRSCLVDRNSARGQKLIEEAMLLLQRSGNRWIYSMILISLGMVAKFNHNYEEARQMLAACEPLFRETGDRHRLNLIKSELAHIDRHEGHIERAKAVYQETILEWQRIGHRAAIAHQLECFASIARMEKQSSHAARLFGAAESLREKTDIPMTALERVEYNREIADLVASLDKESFVASWAEGRALTMDQAVDLAVSPLARS